MQVGVFGGSFNPIHNGHVALGRELVAKGWVDELWYMVSPQNPLKQQDGLMPEDLRLELVRLALQDDEALVACDFEFSLPRPSYTVHTLEALRSAYPEHEFVLVIGADNLLAFNRWYRTDEILRHHRVLVYRRPGYDLSDGLQQSLSPCRDRIRVVTTNLYDISSTEIRAAMQMADYDGSALPLRVWEKLKALSCQHK